MESVMLTAELRSRMHALLDNIVWHTLSGPQAAFATGTGAVRRYAPGFSQLVGFLDPQRPDLDGLARHCTAGERLYSDIWSGPPSAGWHVLAETTMFKMVWAGAQPEGDEAPDAEPLGAAHAQSAVALAEVTRPGPFGVRTIELGEYFGYVDGGRLVAMAGERMQAGTLREISGVCTHPDYQGRGLATRLMRKLIRREMMRGQTPFLHVVRENAGARRLYERMGFRVYLETVVRVISPA
jgi:ribosomal protein S18 acetylase RimI-like enzyme